MATRNFRASEINGLQKYLVELLDNARDIAQIPIIITSGLRTPEQNKLAGGVADSSHLKGLAVDIKINNSNELFILSDALLKAGFVRLGLYKDHIHADIDNLKPQKVIWLG